MPSPRTPKQPRRAGPYESIAVCTVMVIAIGIALFTGSADHKPEEDAVAAPFVKPQPPAARPQAKRDTAKRRAVTTQFVPTPAPPVTPHRDKAPPPSPKRFTLTVKAVGPGSVGLCDGRHSCWRTYDAGTRLRVRARPEARGAFDRWEGCGARCRIAMTRDRTITAHFLREKSTVSWTGEGCGDACPPRVHRERLIRATIVHPPRVTLTLTVGGDGDVAIDGADGPADCVRVCAFSQGDRVTLHASYDHAARTLAWSDTNCTGDDCALVMQADTAVTATFSIQSRTLDVGSDGSGSVVVGQTRCPGPERCTHSYDFGTPLTLVAEPAQGFDVSGWDGCPEAVDDKCDLKLTDDRTVTAHFRDEGAS